MNRAALLAPTFLLAATATLSACGANDGYPSLAKRPAERVTGSAPVVEASPAPPPAPALADPALESRLARLELQAGDAHARFAAQVPASDLLTAQARRAPVASEAWSVANIALAKLESRRSEAMVALADLDELYVKDRIDGGDGLAIAAVRDRITAWVADEDAVLAELRTRLAD